VNFRQLRYGTLSNRVTGKDPITLYYTHGLHEVIPGLEKGLSGMEINEEKSFCVQPEEGYGPLDPNAKKSQRPKFLLQRKRSGLL
jgi:FKBP-type peptidyl-prolyl cis-trans isomerase 2